MLDALRFVSTAVARKDFIPDLTHFKIEDGRITGFNGMVALSSDIDLDLTVMPSAGQLIDAIRACKETISLNVTETGRLAVKSGKFRAYVNCLPKQSAVFVEPEGQSIDMGPDFLTGIKKVAPIMGIDASRPWAMGIKLVGESMFATNNVMMVQYWHGSPLPFDIIIPAAAVSELLRINEDPTEVQLTSNSITFWFGNERWLRTQLVVGDGWPIHLVDKIMAIESNTLLTPFPVGFFDAVKTLEPFVGERSTIYLEPTGLRTERTEGAGACFDMETGLPCLQAYHLHQLTLLGEVADRIDWSNYPGPCKFKGGSRMRGALIGQRLDT
jgi:hypothetical protein